ncbi:hypothetical protein M0534_03705 [Methylonatrum kenyense]|uniref:PilZ domain-containing protein n=1 Tax=Methylonatrum kenyense TaxID=455253 RepID=UPI0020C1085E|nr:PilZ domain-containing protein [Methylonatrum kenyense]MCK8515440.1 hypothetical protein [Methylonatrum kenyense]
MENRQNVRLPLALSGQLTMGALRNQVVETRDVGLRGARVSPVPSNIRPGDACTLTLFIADSDVDCVSIRCRVCHADGGACGVSFLEADATDFVMLGDYLSRTFRDDPRLQAEIIGGQTPTLTDWSQTLN